MLDLHAEGKIYGLEIPSTLKEYVPWTRKTMVNATTGRGLGPQVERSCDILNLHQFQLLFLRLAIVVGHKRREVLFECTLHC